MLLSASSCHLFNTCRYSVALVTAYCAVNSAQRLQLFCDINVLLSTGKYYVSTMFPSEIMQTVVLCVSSRYMGVSHKMMIMVRLT